jgi:cell division protein FtsL
LRKAAAELSSPAPPKRRPRVKSWIAFSLAVVVAFFGLIFSRISLDRSAFVLEDLEQQISEEEARQGALRVEVARLQAPNRISGLAEDMGLIYPATLISLEAPPSIVQTDFEYQWARSPILQAAQP